LCYTRNTLYHYTLQHTADTQTPHLLCFVLSRLKGPGRLLQYICGHTRATGWRRPIGCLKLQVIFRKRATNYRALLRKATYKDKTSYDSRPPCKSKQTRLNSLGVLSYICYSLIYVNIRSGRGGLVKGRGRVW